MNILFLRSASTVLQLIAIACGLFLFLQLQSDVQKVQSTNEKQIHLNKISIYLLQCGLKSNDFQFAMTPEDKKEVLSSYSIVYTELEKELNVFASFPSSQSEALTVKELKRAAKKTDTVIRKVCEIWADASVSQIKRMQVAIYGMTKIQLNTQEVTSTIDKLGDQLKEEADNNRKSMLILPNLALVATVACLLSLLSWFALEKFGGVAKTRNASDISAI